MRADELARADAAPVLKQPRERRSAPRSITICRMVRVEGNGDEGLARCRNISDTGMNIDTAMHLQLNHTVHVAFSSTIALRAHVAWINGNECGLAFDQRVDSAALLRRSAEEARADETYALRLKTALPAKVSFDGKTHEVVVSDMFPHGMRLTNAGNFFAGLKVKVRLAGGREAVAVVRWTRDDTADLCLLEPFSVDELGSVRFL